MAVIFDRLLADGFEVLGFYPKMGLEDDLSELVELHLHAMRAIKLSVF